MFIRIFLLSVVSTVSQDTMADDFDIEAMLEAPYKKVSTLLRTYRRDGANALLHIM